MKECILLIPNKIKKEIIKEARKKYYNYNIKFMSLEDFIKKITFNYNNKTIYLLMKKFSINYDTAIVYLTNIYYISDNLKNNKMAKLIEIKKYLDENNLLILQAIVDYHSVNDNRIKLIFDNYEIEERFYERYTRLAKILKDADALDRKRFAEKCNAALNPEFLRFSKSKELITLSEEINRLYYTYMEQQNISIDELEYTNSDCLHSIGFDYFRIGSILKNGILSFKKMRDCGINFPKNFDGGNGNRWISVVPTNMINKNGDAFKNFIKGGITFLSQNQKLYKPMEYNRKFEAIEKGLPYDKSGYIDEMYAFLEILNQDIVAIIVTKEYANKDVREMEYLYNSLDFDTLKTKIAYIFENIGYTELESNYELCDLLNEYKNELNKYMKLSIDEKNELERDMPRILNPILVKINKIIGDLIHDYYANKLEKKQEDRVSVMEVVNYELVNNHLGVSLLNCDEEIICVINHEYNDTKKLTYKI